MTTVTLRDVDPRNIHRQITQLETLHQELEAHDLTEADMMRETLKLLHQIEETLRHDARVAHHRLAS